MPPWILTAVLAAAASPGVGDERPPSVVLIVVDTLRADHVHGYGYSRETTPNLDRLIAGGVRFEQAIAHSSWSAPSHASILTGARPCRHAVQGWKSRLPDGIDPLAVHLKRLGYATGLFATHKVLYRNLQRIEEGMDVVQVAERQNDREVLELASRWVARQREPYFCFVALLTPHAPYRRYPVNWDDEYFLELPPGGEREVALNEGVSGIGGIPARIALDGETRVGAYVNAYDRAVRFADLLLGEFLDRLKRSRRLERTVVVVTSDHGEGFGEHDLFGHGTYLYDELVRVPLVFHFPGVIPPAQEWAAPVQSADIAPTLLGLVGAAVPRSMDGADLSAHLCEASRPQRERLALASLTRSGWQTQFMVRSTDRKLIKNATTGVLELYDLTADPGEQVNLLAGEDAPEVDRRMLQALDKLMALHARLGPAPEEGGLSDEDLEELRALGYIR